ncbi:MAG TPA: hypothetical protein VLT16_14305 [Candidatus Limnocylindrales bacterium]|nr:hypothetical protein [Candidatus Limnocylindrales bacterium]
MMFDFITIFLVGAILLFAAYTVLQFRGKFPRRTVDDVTPYLRPAELEALQTLLDPALETNFRLRMPPAEFRDWQRKRIHLMREYLLRMSHNALVLIEWGNMEFTEENASPRRAQELQALAQELVQAATEFRLYALLALGKLKLWIILRPTAPSLPGLRKVFGIDALAAYDRLKTAAGCLGLAHGNDYGQELLERL